MTRRVWRAGAFLLLAALACWVGGAAPAPSDDPQRAYAAGQFEEARRLWAPRAEAGDAQAQLGLGVLYDVGQGVGRDPATAYRWYRRAADAGLAEAQFNIAVMYDTGEAVSRDLAEAALWYARAAAHGNRRAQYNLGQLYEAGQGVPLNPEQAEVWYAVVATDLPAAADKLAALRRNSSLRAGRRPKEDDALIPAKPAVPADGGHVVRRGPVSIELAWVAPANPVPVRFFVELVVLGSGEPREAFTAYLEQSASLVPLSRVPGRYAWRVYTVDRDGKHYAVSPWSRFSAEAPE